MWLGTLPKWRGYPKSSSCRECLTDQIRYLLWASFQSFKWCVTWMAYTTGQPCVYSTFSWNRRPILSSLSEHGLQFHVEPMKRSSWPLTFRFSTTFSTPMLLQTQTPKPMPTLRPTSSSSASTQSISRVHFQRKPCIGILNMMNTDWKGSLFKSYTSCFNRVGELLGEE